MSTVLDGTHPTPDPEAWPGLHSCEVNEALNEGVVIKTSSVVGTVVVSTAGIGGLRNCIPSMGKPGNCGLGMPGSCTLQVGKP